MSNVVRNLTVCHIHNAGHSPRRWCCTTPPSCKRPREHVRGVFCSAMDTAPKTSGDTRLEKGIVQAKKHRVTDQALQAWASSVGSEETRSHVRQKSEAGAKADRGLRGFIGGMYEDWIVNLEEAERLTLQQRKDRDPRVQAIP